MLISVPSRGLIDRFWLGADTLALNLNLPFPFLTYTVSPIWNGTLLVCASVDGSLIRPMILGVINLPVHPYKFYKTLQFQDQT